MADNKYDQSGLTMNMINQKIKTIRRTRRTRKTKPITKLIAEIDRKIRRIKA
jgi:hypothetical protein